MGGGICKGICQRFRVRKATNTPYQDGLKHCIACNIWSKEDDTRCECCGMPYRTHTRTAYTRRSMTLTTERY